MFSFEYLLMLISCSHSYASIRLQARPGEIRTFFFFFTHPENLFGTYYEKGDLIAKKDVPSVEEQDDPLTNANRYVLADITSFFTLLVGIYFPSVTGKHIFGLGCFLSAFPR